MNEKVNNLITRLQSISEVSKEDITDLVIKCNIDVDSLSCYADLNHPVNQSYGRKEVFSNEKIKVLVMTWLPQDYSTIHDHGSVELSVLQVFGELVHNQFECKNKELTLLSCHRSDHGSVLLLTKDAIHQMGNEKQEPVLSLHIYFNANSNDISKNYDLYSGQILHTDLGAYYCIPEESIVRREYGLSGKADLIVEETFRRNYRQERIQNTMVS